MVSMMMGVKDIFHRLLGGLLDICKASLCAAGIVGVHDNQIILHLDPDIVAVTLFDNFTLSEPNSRADLLHISRSCFHFLTRACEPKSSKH